jgi:hypothetical protein
MLPCKCDRRLRRHNQNAYLCSGPPAQVTMLEKGLNCNGTDERFS